MHSRGFRNAADRGLTATCLLLLALAGCAGNPAPAPAGAGATASGRLLIPVAGVRPQELRDSYHEPRSGGRQHLAIDIAAPRGTPVYAVANGTILRLHQGNVGGITIYQLDADGQTRYYYAHLFRYARGLREGQRVRRGDVIGYVGDTGNAGRGNYHLHFSIAVLDDPRRWWEGTNLNPYPLLKNGVVKR